LPLYEYQCRRCGRFEIIQKFSDSPLTACPTCGQEVQKLLSAPAIQFKGTGWYVTDYARKSSDGEGAKPAKDSGSEGGSTQAASKGGEGASSSAPTKGSAKDGSASGSSPK